MTSTGQGNTHETSHHRTRLALAAAGPSRRPRSPTKRSAKNAQLHRLPRRSTRSCRSGLQGGVAKKYKARPTAHAKLAEKVKKGGSGVWGAVSMPPNAAVPDGDVTTLVAWVLKM